MERSPELESVLRRLYAAFESGDVDLLVPRYSSSPAFLSVGTDPKEIWTDVDAFVEIIRAQTTETADMRVLDLRVRAWEEGTMGWAFAEPRWSHPDGPVETRDTWVFRLERGEWRVVHTHTSIGVSNVEALGRELTTSVERVAAAVEAERPDVSSVAAPDGTVTLVFTDIEDSTVLTERLGDERWMTVLRSHDETVRGAVEAHGGYVVKHLGDGFMLAFGSARGAVRAASEAQRTMDEVRVDGAPLRVRAGIHAGEAIRQGNDLYGKAVVLAARIASNALGGQVLVSDLVRGLCEGTDEFGFRDLGELVLKGLSGRHRVFELTRG